MELINCVQFLREIKKQRNCVETELLPVSNLQLSSVIDTEVV